MADEGASQSRDVFSHYGGGNQNINTGSGTMYTIQNAYYFTDPRDDMTRIMSTEGGLLTESYSWILQHDDFRRWEQATDTNRLLWIRGDPGKGKTMLLCGIIKELEKTETTPIYFFCQATDIRLNTATNVLRGLLYMLVRQHPSLIDLFREKYEDAGRTLFEDRNAWNVLCEMLHATLRHEALRNVVLVIDALDECSTDLDQLIDLIIDISSTVKVVISSRNWLSIQNSMAEARDKVPICLEWSPGAVSDAVNSFIDARVGLLSKFDNQTRNMVRSHLIEHSNGTFLWVALVLEVKAEISSMNFSSDGAMLASAFCDGTVDLWSTTTGQHIQTMDTASSANAVSIKFSADDSLLLSASTDGAVQLWDVTNDQHLRTLYKHRGGARVAVFSAQDGKLIASAGGDGVVNVFETSTGSCLHTFSALKATRHDAIAIS
ncbi:vegetative incompatibility protein het-e-1 [Colletotrichum plurivorum]|uniref:Vegetative incompatibility protein het-e-1 n=1 Tax=Colletotrichum plurivorum TaxID=2175906 RepID=A0A8H6JN69_9PEZI|nr:vegetative incompatibility protein het-e-1 [Colletotrichum plurivorum]